MNNLSLDLLVALRATGEHGSSLPLLLIDLRRGRHRGLTEPELLKALRDLADRCHAIAFVSATGSDRWRATAAGKSALEEEGL
jgi:hypothetical protein